MSELPARPIPHQRLPGKPHGGLRPTDVGELGH